MLRRPRFPRVEQPRLRQGPASGPANYCWCFDFAGNWLREQLLRCWAKSRRGHSRLAPLEAEQPVRFRPAVAARGSDPVSHSELWRFAASSLEPAAAQGLHKERTTSLLSLTGLAIVICYSSGTPSKSV